MSIFYQAFTMEHYDAVYALWSATEGVGLSDADERGQIAAFLERNPGCGFVCVEDGNVIGAVLAGHDGRRGFLYHLAVSPQHRRRGIGKALANQALDALRAQGIAKCHIMVFASNERGQAFWRSVGFLPRADIALMSMDL